MNAFSRMKCKKLHSFVYLSSEDSLTFVPEHSFNRFLLLQQKEQSKQKKSQWRKKSGYF